MEKQGGEREREGGKKGYARRLDPQRRQVEVRNAGGGTSLGYMGERKRQTVLQDTEGPSVKEAKNRTTEQLSSLCKAHNRPHNHGLRTQGIPTGRKN